MSSELTRAEYAARYGPTTGDRVRLGDTNLLALIERDEWRVAHARVLFASNAVFGALLSFYYWEDDATWAVPAWERMVETLRLGDRGLLRPDPESRRN